ncbi:MAG: 1-deoxy-D-xylulose-5-phosphate synthase [Legionellales bacterium]|nr:1-deoxy-D-xylulose-5-phosphate synthase [Legionellales bacterium]
MEYLDRIDTPEDLRKLPETALEPLVKELREFLLESTNVSGGHLGAGLGVAELTVALHYVFNTPHDNLIWDVGHQAYPHKILTGRKNEIHTIRQTGGVAPFPERSESPYDAFTVGHSSTSIGAALGMAWANGHSEDPTKSNIAVIGDGGMTAGMAFEALNHAGTLDSKLLVVLNDNDMSISNNVGALSNYFARILSSKMYTSIRAGSKKILGRIPPVWEFARRTESHLKGMVAPGTLFEELGFNYIGPIDGHDVNGLVRMLRNLKDLPGPQLLHIITQKGRGFEPAEDDPIRYHAVSPAFYNEHSQKPTPSSTSKTSDALPKKVSYSAVFGQWMCDAAAQDPDVVAITPAMREGSGLVEYAQRFPDQYVDVGIAEQHSITFAAGLACEGKKPVVAIYSSFLQRAYDQLVHDVALPNLPVVFAVDRAGPVPDGPTHNGVYDLSFLRAIPNVTLMTPSSANEAQQMLSTGLSLNSPAVVRYPRASCSAPSIPYGEIKPLPVGKAELVREGQSIALLAFGPLLEQAKAAAEHFDATLVNMRFVKPLDEQMIASIAKNHTLIVTLEENTVYGGAGSAVLESLSRSDYEGASLTLGIPDRFLAHGNPSDIFAEVGLNAEGIIRQIEQKISKKAKLPLDSESLTA